MYRYRNTLRCIVTVLLFWRHVEIFLLSRSPTPLSISVLVSFFPLLVFVFGPVLLPAFEPTLIS